MGRVNDGNLLLLGGWVEAIRKVPDHEKAAVADLILALADFQRDGTPPPDLPGTVGIIESIALSSMRFRKVQSEGGKKGAEIRAKKAAADPAPEAPAAEEADEDKDGEEPARKVPVSPADGCPQESSGHAEAAPEVPADAPGRYLNEDCKVPARSPARYLQGDLQAEKKREVKVKEKEKNGTSPPSPPPGGESLFPLFWKEYPRKQGRKAAEAAFDKLRPDPALFSEILRAVRAQSASEQWRKDDGRFIPLPATWLCGRRWEDELNTSGSRAGRLCAPLGDWSDVMNNDPFGEADQNERK